MSVYNFTDSSIAGMKKQLQTTPRGFECFILRNILDTTLQNIANDSSVIQALNVEAGTTVLACWLNVLTPDATGGTFELGVTTDAAAHWGTDWAMTEGIDEPGTTPVYNPWYFSADNTIDLTEDGAQIIDEAIIEIVALCVKSSSTVDAGE
jgi:hypothetical protein